VISYSVHKSVFAHCVCVSLFIGAEQDSQIRNDWNVKRRRKREREREVMDLWGRCGSCCTFAWHL